MPPDQQAQAFLDARKAFMASRPKPAGPLTVGDVRANLSAWRAVSTGAPKTPVDTVFERDIPIEGGRLKARLYRHGDRPVRPGLLYYHGGGFVMGHLDHSDEVCRRLAIVTGYLIVNVDYRLAPEHPYPAAPEDSYAAFRWTASQAEQLGIEASKIAVAGQSAGGSLVAAVCLMARDRGDPMPAAQIIICPGFGIDPNSESAREYGEGYVGSPEEGRLFRQAYLPRPEDAEEPYASPMKATSLAGLPPALVITAECDALRDGGERFATRMKEEGGSVILSRCAGALHAFFSSPHIFDTGAAAVEEAARFLADRMERTG